VLAPAPHEPLRLVAVDDELPRQRAGQFVIGAGRSGKENRRGQKNEPADGNTLSETTPTRV
jgi:hypothetical protein